MASWIPRKIDETIHRVSNGPAVDATAHRVAVPKGRILDQRNDVEIFKQCKPQRSLSFH